MQAANSVHACSHIYIWRIKEARLRSLWMVGAWTASLSSPFAADEEFDELCFDFGIELDEVVR